MTVVELTGGSLTARLSTRGGIVLGLCWERSGTRVPLLREASSDDADARSSGCYPLVPFGNRVKDNCFTFRGKKHVFEPNTSWDPHYLHGEGWRSEWTVLRQSGSEAEFGFSHEGAGTPYAYEARQRFAIQDDRFDMHLQVDAAFDPDFQRDYFSFEPMSHLANGHNLPDLGDLTILEPGEAMTASLQLRPEAIA